MEVIITLITSLPLKHIGMKSGMSYIHHRRKLKKLNALIVSKYSTITYDGHIDGYMSKLEI